MLISFLGCPASGKTTLAAMLFAEAKRLGISNTDLLTEQARLYIAEKRLRNADIGLSEDYPLLCEEDQVNIMTDQVSYEEAMDHALPEGLVVTDTAPFNCLLYMPPAVRESHLVQSLLSDALDLPRMVFYCPPIIQVGEDANRVHTQEQSLAIDQVMPGVFMHYLPDVWLEAKTLAGGLEERFKTLRLEVARRFPELNG
jgi:hypothetical protein